VHMDGVTQQNAALVEQAAAAAESLQEQATQLEQAVSVFKLNGQQEERIRAPLRKSTVEAPAARQAPRLGSKQVAKTPAKKAAPRPVTDDGWEQF